MLVHDFTYIHVPAGVVRAHLVEGPRAWLDSLATQAAAAGDALSLRLGPHGQHSTLSKHIAVEIGQAVPRDGAVVVPLTWHATGAPALFPVFSGDIELAAIGGAETQLSIWGRYDPPLGAFGEALDRFGLHRVAEASVRAFLRDLAQSIEASERTRRAAS
ncbi:MAG: hypothetical protein JOZ75_11990 [Candidatus Dormibacteraeota bacterium]|nr:hypothetical protein [Candidatus Dormibacteraeota bacterium]